jgi:hypothetical protein
LDLVAILPEELVRFLSTSEDWEPCQWLPRKRVLIDLFEPSEVATNAVIADELVAFLTLVETGELLGLTKRQAHRAAQMGKAMRNAGLQDPYIRLDKAPAAASRWRVGRRKRRKAELQPERPSSDSGVAGKDPTV